MFDSGDDDSRIPTGFEVNMQGKHLHSWILQAACDFIEMKAKGRKKQVKIKTLMCCQTVER